MDVGVKLSFNFFKNHVLFSTHTELIYRLWDMQAIVQLTLKSEPEQNFWFIGTTDKW